MKKKLIKRVLGNDYDISHPCNLCLVKGGNDACVSCLHSYKLKL